MVSWHHLMDGETDLKMDKRNPQKSPLVPGPYLWSGEREPIVPSEGRGHKSPGSGRPGRISVR